ncbi:Probable BOI-related E3 ubiquitin-protein ligase 3 [Linum perenne]
MAVEARHLNLFPSQLLGSREMMNSVEPANTTNVMYNSQSGYAMPSSGTTEALLPMYTSLVTDSSFHHQKTPMMKSEVSGLTSYNNIPMTRKRPRESTDVGAGAGAGGVPPLFCYPAPQLSHISKAGNSPQISFLGHDFSLQIQQQQLDADRLISLHMEKVRAEMEEERRRQARRIIQVIEEGMVKRLKAKEEEIKKIGKLNWALEEKVKSLCMENQIWRDLAQTNEATANALRSNLEKVLETAQEQRAAGDDAAALIDDAQSCCGSNADRLDDDAGNCSGGRREDDERRSMRMCRKCGGEESCVLLLPCRHLCLCSGCESTIHSCPICKATKNASFHVNMSSS